MRAKHPGGGASQGYVIYNSITSSSISPHTNRLALTFKVPNSLIREFIFELGQ